MQEMRIQAPQAPGRGREFQTKGTPSASLEGSSVLGLILLKGENARVAGGGAAEAGNEQREAPGPELRVLCGQTSGPRLSLRTRRGAM